METAAARWLDRWSVATGYVVALALATLALAVQPRPERAGWLDWSSTNLVNLHDHPVRAMLFSAVLSEGTIVGWVPMALVGLGACGVALGAWRTLLLVAAAHVTGTVVSQGIVDYRIAHAALGTDAATMRDIGPSYVVTAAVVAGVAYGPRLGRLACAACLVLLLPGLFGGLPDLAVASVGHVCSVVVALGLGALLAWSVRRRRRAREPAHSPVPETGRPAYQPPAVGAPPAAHAAGQAPAPPDGRDGDGGQTRYSTSQ